MLLTDLTSPQVNALSRDIPVIFPVAALEQHGGHLPLFTDSLLLGEIMRRVVAQVGNQILVAPLMWLGSSHHHLDFPGTLSASPRHYLDLLGGLLDNFITHGFRRLVLVNGHGGNDVPGRQAVFEARQRHRTRPDLLLLFATYWQLGAKPWEAEPNLQQHQMGHACEWETSMMLRLAPDLVGPLDGIKPVPLAEPFAPAGHGWTTKERTSLGYIGDPAIATAEKGESLFQTFALDIVAFLERVKQCNGKPWDS
jgi:creatinine amidohydrolase